MVSGIFFKLLSVYFPHVLSFSQEGEDKILERIFENKTKGFFIDVGAHHPIRYSNTYKLYLKGWRGINIDAMPHSMKAFNKIRPDDINIEAAISDEETTLTYYAFNDPALNGFSKEISQQRNGSKGYKIIFEKEIKTQKLETILSNKLPSHAIIDFMTIDAEGLDLKILMSNNWKEYRPKIIVVEVPYLDMENLSDNPTINFLNTVGYKFFAKTYFTAFFIQASEKFI